MKDLFTVHQVSRCCGLSRATILRLERKGLLRPAFIDAQSGYRYYDNHNVSRIMQIQLFLKMGMPYDDIQLYYRMGGASQELLEQAEARLSIMKRVCEEIRLRVENREHLSFEFVTLPQYVCFTGEFQGTTVENRYWAMYNLYHQAVERGYRLLATEPLFVINRRNDFIRGAFTEDVVNFTCCIPLEPDTAPEDAVVYPAPFPACTVEIMTAARKSSMPLGQKSGNWASAPPGMCGASLWSPLTPVRTSLPTTI